VSENSSVSEVTGYALDVWPSLSSRDSDFSLRNKIQTSSEAQPVLYPVVTGRVCVCVCVKLPEPEAYLYIVVPKLEVPFHRTPSWREEVLRSVVLRWLSSGL
jgi:hypothetical protein